MKTKPKVAVTTNQYAEMRGVTRQSVARAIAKGDIPPAAVERRGKGKRWVFVIVDVDLANRSWSPVPDEQIEAASEPGPLSNLAEDRGARDLIRQAKRRYEAARAQREELHLALESGKLIEIKTAIEVFGRMVTEAKTKLLAVARHARSRLPHLSVDDMLVVEGLIREALEELSAEEVGRAGKGGRS